MEQKTNLSDVHKNKENKQEYAYYHFPNIMTGGGPVLLDKIIMDQKIIKPLKCFSKYIFYDDDKNVKIKVEVPEELKDKLTADAVKTTFSPVSIDLQASVEGFDTYSFVIKKFVNKIVPKESKVRVVKNKIVVTLRKANEDEEWDKLQ